MTRNRIWRTVQNSTWLLGGVAMLAVAFFLWIGLQIHQRTTVEKELKAKDTPVEPAKVQFSHLLGMMTDMVPELDLNQNVSTGERTTEFRGASFVKSQSGNWTVQVMSVSQEDIIKSYLDRRADRRKFFYMRSQQPDRSERYILVYDSFPSVDKALSASKTVNFDLPTSVKAYPVRFSEFKSSITDDTGSEDTITNLSRAAQVYQVRLRAVPVPVERPVAPAVNASAGFNAGGSNTASSNAGGFNTGGSNTASSNIGASNTGTANTAGSNAGMQRPAAPGAVANPALRPAVNGSAASTVNPARPPATGAASTENNPASTAPIVDPFN